MNYFIFYIEFLNSCIFKFCFMIRSNPYHFVIQLHLYLLGKNHQHFKSFIFESQKHGPIIHKKLSTLTKIYFFPLLLWTFISPHKYMWSSSRDMMLVSYLFCLNGTWFIFLTQVSHTLMSKNCNLGTLRTRYFETNLLRCRELTWPNLLCYKSIFSLWVLRKMRSLLETQSRSATYMFLHLLSLRTTLPDWRLMIVHQLDGNLTSLS